MTTNEPTNLETNFSALSTETQRFLYWSICKLDLATYDVSIMRNTKPEVIREEIIKVIANTLDENPRIRLLMLHVIAIKNELPEDSFNCLNDHTRDAVLTLINSGAYAITELWSSANTVRTLEEIQNLISRDATKTIKNVTTEEITFYFQSMDDDNHAEPEDDLQILILPYMN